MFLFFCQFFFCIVLFSQTGPRVQEVNQCSNDHGKGDLYKVVESMPVPKGCENETEIKARQACIIGKLNSHIANHELYKTIESDKTAKGSMYLSFVVERDGCLAEVNIKRDVCEGCGDIVKRIFKTADQWIAGSSKNGPVRVLQNYLLHFPMENAN